MSHPTNSFPEREFDVKVGLAECRVKCRSEEEAVQKARRQLGEQMPRMWDVIQGIADREFRVDQVG